MRCTIKGRFVPAETPGPAVGSSKRLTPEPKHHFVSVLQGQISVHSEPSLALLSSPRARGKGMLQCGDAPQTVYSEEALDAPGARLFNPKRRARRQTRIGERPHQTDVCDARLPDGGPPQSAGRQQDHADRLRR